MDSHVRAHPLHPIFSKSARAPRVGVAAILFGLLGVGFRVWLTAVDAPPTNSDEATFGLVALHVLQGRSFPVFLYGQSYMGTLESYLAAPLIWLTGPTTYALRTVTLLCYALFLVTMYVTTKRLYSGGLALLTVTILALGSDRVVKDQIIADGSAELGVLVALLVLLAALLGMGQVRHRLRLFGAWGFIAGLALWDHLLVLPYLAASAALLMFASARELRGRAGLAAFGGLLLGALPMLIHNATAPFKNNSIAVLLHYNSVGSDAPLLDRLHGGIMLGVPLATGVCDPSNCHTWQTWWGPIYIGLLMVSGVFAIRAARLAAGPDRIKELARLALVVGALATIASYTKSPSAADSPIESARYLSLLVVSTPAAIWPLWKAIIQSTRPTVRFLATMPLAALLAAMLAAALALGAHAPDYGRQAKQQRELLQTMNRLGVTRYYTGYWTCNRLAYANNEQSVCAVLADDLRPGFNRYAPYRSRVAAAETVAYLAPIGSEFDRNVASYLNSAGTPPRVTEVAGYRIYQPDRALHPPLAQEPLR